MSKQPWLYRLFWVGFHASTAMLCGMLALFNVTFLPWAVWAVFALLTAFLSYHNYQIWLDAEVKLEELKRRRRGQG
jgi:hypothetical protein